MTTFISDDTLQAVEQGKRIAEFTLDYAEEDGVLWLGLSPEGMLCLADAHYSCRGQNGSAGAFADALAHGFGMERK